MLPPKQSAKRNIGVNIRFNTVEYERLKRIAEYCGISVTALLHYVITNGLLPRLEREMRKEQAREQPAHAHVQASGSTSGPPDWPDDSLDGSVRSPISTWVEL
jgi:hypothetical protein